MSDLKPCPFCGSIDRSFDTNQGTKWGFVSCSGCAAQGPEVRTQYHADAWHGAAAEAWNERTTPAPMDKETSE